MSEMDPSIPPIYLDAMDITRPECVEPIVEPAFPIDSELNVQPLTLRDKLKNRVSEIGIYKILSSAIVDWKESENKTRATLSGAVVAATQVVGITRLPSVLVPPVTVEILQQTGSPLEAGIATAAIFGAWSLTVGRSLKSGINNYPKAVNASAENFANLTEHFSNSLPGLSPSRERNADNRQAPIIKRLGSFALRHARRGFTAYAVGITPYIGVAGIKKQSDSDIRRLSLALSIDAAGVVGLLSTGVAEVIVGISKNNPALARTIQEDVGNAKIWYGVAGALMLGEWAKNKRNRSRLVESTEDIPKIDAPLGLEQT